MEPGIIVALDFPERADAVRLARRLDPGRCRLKVGKESFVRAGPALVEDLHRLGFEVFLDLKFHDIPNTVAGACRAAAALGVWMVDVHASGGRAMLEAAREALGDGPGSPLLVAVTVLTSLDGGGLREVGVERPPAEQVALLAALADECGADGVVCSPADLVPLGAVLAPRRLRVTPGVRPAGSAAGDQRRIATPAAAAAAGADHLVIGRPVTAAPDPAAALEAVAAQIRSVRGA